MRKEIVLTLILTAATASLGSWLRLSSTEHYLASQHVEDLYYVPDADWLPTLSLGHRAALADLLWMRSLVYYGEGIGARMTLRHVVDYAAAITTLDDSFLPVYRFTTTAAAYQLQTPPIEDLVRAANFLEAGARRHPESGEIAWAAGSFWSFELAPRYPAHSSIRRTAQARGAEYLLRAARRGAGPAWLAFSNAGILMQLGSRERAIQHLEEMYELTTDPQIRARLGRDLASIRGIAEREATDQALRDARTSWHDNYPYLPPMLYELVGPRSVLDGSMRPADTSRRP